MATPTSNLRIFPAPDQLCRAAAAQTAQMISGHQGQRFRLALSGGRTPEALYRILATEYATEIPWGKVELFWGDERYVPHDHPASNAAMVRRSLLDHINIPANQVHPIPTGAGNPASDAAAYQQTLQACAETEGELLRFDLLLLGMGDDGHTASLFAGDALLGEHARDVGVSGPHAGLCRLSLTLPALNRARCVVWLALGAGRQRAVARLFAADRTMPASLVARERATAFTDPEAAP